MTHAETGGKSGRFKLLKIYPAIISHTLKEEIARRKIPYELANLYLQQVFVLDRKTQKKFIALTFQNRLNDYEMNIPYPSKGNSFKATLGTNSYTFIEGCNRDHVEVFQSFWDFLTWLAMMHCQLPKFSTYILNGRKSLEEVKASIESRRAEIKSVSEFLDNDEAGESLREQLSNAVTGINSQFASQNYFYRAYKDLSDYWITDPEAQSIWPLKDV